MRTILLLPLLALPVVMAQTAVPSTSEAVKTAAKEIGKGGEDRPVGQSALQNAVKGMGKVVKKSAERAEKDKRIFLMGGAANPRRCSVPLTVVKPDEKKAYAIQRMPVGPTSPMPQAVVPAPPCEGGGF